VKLSVSVSVSMAVNVVYCTRPQVSVVIASMFSRTSSGIGPVSNTFEVFIDGPSRQLDACGDSIMVSGMHRHR
jgi:hypothetical protein